MDFKVAYFTPKKEEGYFTKPHKFMNSTGIYTTVHAWLHFAVAVVLLLTMSESDRTWCATHWDPPLQNVSSCWLTLKFLSFYKYLITLNSISILKYGFCKKLLLYEWNFGQLNTFFIKIRFSCNQNRVSFAKK